jgi:hypothetical protein
MTNVPLAIIVPAMNVYGAVEILITVLIQRRIVARRQANVKNVWVLFTVALVMIA